RGMPVHRIPGSARGSVYALTEELDAWLGAAPPDDGASAATGRSPPQSSGERPAARRWTSAALVAGLTVAGLGLAVYAWPEVRAPTPRILVPQDASAAALYVEARADWAWRTPSTLLAAIGKLKRVVAAEPEF